MMCAFVSISNSAMVPASPTTGCVWGCAYGPYRILPDREREGNITIFAQTPKAAFVCGKTRIQGPNPGAPVADFGFRHSTPCSFSHWTSAELRPKYSGSTAHRSLVAPAASARIPSRAIQTARGTRNSGPSTRQRAAVNPTILSTPGPETVSCGPTPAAQDSGDTT